MSSRSRSRSRSPARKSKATASPVATKSSPSKSKSSSNSSSTLAAWFRPRVLHVILLVIVGGTAASVELHRREHGVINPWQALLAFFLILNSFIAVCEQHLHVGASYITRQSRVLISKFGNGKERSGAVAWFLLPLTRKNWFHHAWADMWASYTLFDPCYASDETFGFWIDSGNGVLTILPSLALLYNLTFPLDAFISPFFMALLSIVIFWTELYGTIIYFWTFVYRGIHREIGAFNTFLFVGCTNGIWFVVPIIGIYLMIQVQQSGSFDIFRK